MTLPTLPLPFPIPETVPVLLHPAVIHFAVVLPIVILIIELINLITKRKSLTISVYVLFVMLAGFFVASFATGVIDGKNGGLLVSDEGLEHLKVHKNIGIYLLYLSALPILLKLLTVVVKKSWAKVIYLVLFTAIIGLTLFQAKEGGELVYKYGLNVEAKVDLDDVVEELQDEVEELKEQIAELESTSTDTKVTETPVESNTSTPVVNVPESNVTAPIVVDINKSVVESTKEANVTKVENNITKK